MTGGDSATTRWTCDVINVWVEQELLLLRLLLLLLLLPLNPPTGEFVLAATLRMCFAAAMLTAWRLDVNEGRRRDRTADEGI